MKVCLERAGGSYASTGAWRTTVTGPYGGRSVAAEGWSRRRAEKRALRLYDLTEGILDTIRAEAKIEVSVLRDEMNTKLADLNDRLTDLTTRPISY
jgi:hypothetical protein